MDSPADPNPSPPPPSLAGVALARVREAAGAVAGRLARWRSGDAPRLSPARGWIVPTALGLLLASIPLSVWAGARMLAAGEQARTAAMARQLAPRSATTAAMARERAAMAALLARPRAIALLDALARTLPQDSRIVRFERQADATIMLDIATPDPAEMRAALRADARFAAYRTLRERRGDAGMIVTLKGIAE